MTIQNFPAKTVYLHGTLHILENILLITIFAATGITAGFLSGLLGIGGGVVVVPILVFLFSTTDMFSTGYSENTPVLVAIGTSLATIVFSTASAAVAQIRRGAIEWRLVKKWTPWLALGSFISSFIADSIHQSSLILILAGVITWVGLIMSSNWQPNPRKDSPGKIANLIIPTLGGFITSLAGIGVSNVVLPTLVYFKHSMVKAAGTASMLATPVALIGAFGYVLNGLEEEIEYSLGYLYLPAIVVISFASFCTAPIGVSVGHKIGGKALRKGFGITMLIVAGILFWKSATFV